MKRWTIPILAVVVFSGRVPAEDAIVPADKTPSTAKVEEVAKDYKQLTLMTKEYVFVEPALAQRCIGVSQQDVEIARKTTGPHARTAIRIFMNAAAAEAFQKGGSAYPVGAVVVKEKQGLTYFPNEPQRQLARIHDGVGGMIKREKGYDPEHGDWEYFYFEVVAKIESGKITSCVRCHDTAAKSDYIFGRWAERLPKK